MKKYLFGLSGLFIALLMSAFTYDPGQAGVKKTSEVWEFNPQGVETSTDAEAYDLNGTIFTCEEGAEEIVCKILAEPDPELDNLYPLIQSGTDPAVDIELYETQFRDEQ